MLIGLQCACGHLQLSGLEEPEILIKTNIKMKWNVGFFQSLMKEVKNLKLSIYFLHLKKSFRFLLSFRYLLFYSYFSVVFYHLFDLWNAEGPTFGNKMVPSEGSHGSEGESSKKILLDLGNFFI